MPHHTMLNNVAHKDLRVSNRFGGEFGHNVGTVVTFPTEYEDMQREYAIFFRKDQASGEYSSVALLGFNPGENLYLEGGHWDAEYLPGMIARGPFLIGFQEQDRDGERSKEAVLHIDLDDPRVGESDGVPLFLPHGGNSAYLDQVAGVLRGIRDGIESSKAMFAAFVAADLLEPVDLQVKVNAEEAYRIVGLHTINQQKLDALKGDALDALHRSGFLRGAILVASSMGNIRRLIRFKQRRRVQQPST